MKTATAKDLRVKTAALLEEVGRGQEVIITYRGNPVAVITPLQRTKRGELNPVGFGMWRNRREMRAVGQWVKRLREPRHRRSSSTLTS